MHLHLVCKKRRNYYTVGGWTGIRKEQSIIKVYNHLEWNLPEIESKLTGVVVVYSVCVKFITIFNESKGK